MLTAPFNSSNSLYRYGLAAVILAIATLLRWLLDEPLGGGFPFITYFAALVVIAWYCGLGPALLSVVVSALLAASFFITLPNSFAIARSSDFVGLMLYCLIGAGIALLSGMIQRARRRPDDSALALAESRERLATILASIGDAVIATDKDGCVTFINAVGQSLIGCNQEEAEGKPIRELLKILDEGTHQPLERALTGVVQQSEENRHFNQAFLEVNDGTRFPIEGSSSPIKNDTGNLIGAVLVFRDITERRLAELDLREKEGRFRAMADTAPVMLWLSGAEGMTTFFNQSWLDFTGRTMEQEIGYGWADNIHPDDLRECLDTYIKSLEARESFTLECRLRRLDGEYRWILNKGAPRYTADGEFMGLAGSCIDITDRKRIEDAAYFLASIVQTTEDAIIGKTLDGAIVSWNAAAERMYGYTADEVKGKHIKLLAPEDRHTELAAIFETLRRGESIPHLETIRRRKDGQLIDIALTISPIHDEAGHITGASTIARDITERKRAEMERGLLGAQIERQRERLDNVIANVPGVVWEAWGKPDEASQRIDFVSEYVEKMLGYSIQEWLGTPNFWLSIVHPDDRERAAEEAAAIFAGRKVGASRFRWVAKDRRVLWVEAQSVVVCDEMETPVGMRGVTMDITERKRAEDAQSFLAEASGLLAGSLDYETTLASVAKLAVPKLADWCTVHIAELTGRLRQLAVAHTDPAKVHAAEELQRRYPLDPDAPIGVPNVLRTGRAEFYPQINPEMFESAVRNEGLAKILRKEGLKSCMIVPLVARNRTLGAVTLLTAESGRLYDPSDLALAEDLAHRIALAVDNARLYGEAQDAVKAREDALHLRDELLRSEHTAREEAETANRAKDEFLATVSHELRTPLNAILGWAHMLRASKLDARTQSRALETIERNAKSQAQLIEDILDVSRIVTGKLRLDVRPVELSSVVEAAIEAVRPAAEAKEIKLQTILDPRAGPVSGDPNRLQQVVWNLAANAVKFTPRSGRVHVRLERMNSHIEITVSDTGQGISPDFLPFVFERFRQADTTSTRSHGGLGLGLAIVRHLVEMHGGSVSAYSPGDAQGATFVVRLPLMIVHTDLRAGIHPTAGGRTPSTHPALDGLRVLVVDDEPDTLALLKIMIEDFGAEVRCCPSAASALELFGEWKPHVLVSDIEMPGEDGYQLIQKLRKRKKEHGGETPAVALTAYARAEDRVRALSTGYQMHLAKPFEPSELATVIASLAGRTVTGSAV